MERRKGGGTCVPAVKRLRLRQRVSGLPILLAVVVTWPGDRSLAPRPASCGVCLCWQARASGAVRVSERAVDFNSVDASDCDGSSHSGDTGQKGMGLLARTTAPKRQNGQVKRQDKKVAESIRPSTPPEFTFLLQR